MIYNAIIKVLKFHYLIKLPAVHIPMNTNLDSKLSIVLVYVEMY